MARGGCGRIRSGTAGSVDRHEEGMAVPGDRDDRVVDGHVEQGEAPGRMDGRRLGAGRLDDAEQLAIPVDDERRAVESTTGAVARVPARTAAGAGSGGHR